MAQAFKESEGSAAPGELAGDLLCLDDPSCVPLPGSPRPMGQPACVSCGAGGCGPGCPSLTGLGNAGGARSIAASAVEAGHEAERANRPDLAMTHYRQALLSDPAAADAHHRLAVLLDRSGSYAAAEQHYGAALAARPGDVDLMCDVGYSLLLQNRLEEAENQFRTALAQRPDHVRSLENLGLLYAKQGDRTRAAGALARTGTKAEADAKLAVLFPMNAPIDARPSAPDVPLWAGIAPNQTAETAPFAPVKRRAAVRTAAAAQPAGRPISLLMTAGAERSDTQRSDAPSLAAPGVPETVEAPYVPPPGAPNAEPGDGSSVDLPTWGGFGAGSAPRTQTGTPSVEDAPVHQTAEQDDMPLWPPVGGFSAAG